MSTCSGRLLLVQDRYSGIYSGGQWLGVIDADLRHGTVTRGAFAVDAGPSDGDQGAEAFWEDPPDWIVAGKSPKHVLDLIAERLARPARHGR